MLLPMLLNADLDKSIMRPHERPSIIDFTITLFAIINIGDLNARTKGNFYALPSLIYVCKVHH